MENQFQKLKWLIEDLIILGYAIKYLKLKIDNNSGDPDNENKIGETLNVFYHKLNRISNFANRSEEEQNKKQYEEYQKLLIQHLYLEYINQLESDRIILLEELQDQYEEETTGNEDEEVL